MVVAIGLLVATALDRPVFHLLTAKADAPTSAQEAAPAPGEPPTDTQPDGAQAAETQAKQPHVIDKTRWEGDDWYKMFRSVGYVPAWLFVGAGFVLIDRRRLAHRVWFRGGFIMGSVLIGGVVSELMKLVIGRERPITGDVYQGAYVFKPFGQAFVDGGNLGMPSSHTAVAFAGAGAMSLLFPGVRPLVLLLACGCALTRLMSGAHWLSDVYIGVVVGLVSAAWLWSRVHEGPALDGTIVRTRGRLG